MEIKEIPTDTLNKLLLHMAMDDSIRLLRAIHELSYTDLSRAVQEELKNRGEL